MNDKYDLDNSELFKTSYTSEYFALQDQNQNNQPKPQLGQSLSESVNATFIQEVDHGIRFENEMPPAHQKSNQITGSKVIEPMQIEHQSNQIEEESQEISRAQEESQLSQKLDILTLDQIPKANQSNEEFKTSMDIGGDTFDKLALDMVDLEMRLNIEVSGPRWHNENIYYGHYVFSIKSYRSGPSQQIGFQLGQSSQEVVEVERRYSDFDLFRMGICCEYPGFFIPMLPPKETFVSLKQEDSDSILKRKIGIKQFLVGFSEHPQLSSEENRTFTNFMSVRSAHQFSEFKAQITKMLENFKFIHAYTSQHTLAGSSSQIAKMLSKVTSSVSNAIFGEEGSTTQVNPTLYGPFALQHSSEVNDFVSFEKYLETLHTLQADILEEIQKFQLTVSQQASNFERLSENFTTFRRMKGQGQEQEMQKQFLSSQNPRTEIDFEEYSVERGTSFNAMVEEVTQTFTTMRDIKRKQAIQQLQELTYTAESQKLYTEAAFEAVQRYKALVSRKYELLNQIRSQRNNSMQRASADAELEQAEESVAKVTQMTKQAKEQITVEIKRFKELKQESQDKLIREFTQLMRESAEVEQQCWERNNGTLAFQAVKTELQGKSSMEDSIDQSILKRARSTNSEIDLSSAPAFIDMR